MLSHSSPVARKGAGWKMLAQPRSVNDVRQEVSDASLGKPSRKRSTHVGHRMA